MWNVAKIFLLPHVMRTRQDRLHLLFLFCFFFFHYWHRGWCDFDSPTYAFGIKLQCTCFLEQGCVLGEFCARSRAVFCFLNRSRKEECRTESPTIMPQNVSESEIKLLPRQSHRAAPGISAAAAVAAFVILRWSSFSDTSQTFIKDSPHLKTRDPAVLHANLNLTF